MATFGFGNTSTVQQLQQSANVQQAGDGANFEDSDADPTKNMISGNITITYQRPIPIYRGFVSGVEFISTAIPPLATNVVIVGYTNTNI